MGFRKYSGIGATVVLVSGCASGGTEAIETFGIESANLQSACVSATPTSGWVNGDIGSRTGRFRVQFDATPASARG